MNRRSFLRAVPAGGTVALAGCAALGTFHPQPRIAEVGIAATGQIGEWTVTQVHPSTGSHPAVIEIEFRALTDCTFVGGDLVPFTEVAETTVNEDSGRLSVWLNPRVRVALEDDADAAYEWVFPITLADGWWRAPRAHIQHSWGLSRGLSPGDVLRRRYALVIKDGTAPATESHQFTHHYAIQTKAEADETPSQVTPEESVTLTIRTGE